MISDADTTVKRQKSIYVISFWTNCSVSRNREYVNSEIYKQ